MENKTLIDELNKEETMRMIPVIIFLLVICVFGLCGNGLSLYVFKTHFKPSSSRLFFMYLSGVEIFSCAVLIPIDISSLFQQLMLVSGYLCVGYIFLLVFQVQVAADILIVIALDRWRKICHPFQWQLSYTMSKRLCIVTVLFGVIEALPSLWLYGAHTVHMDVYNITGEECSINDSVRETVYPVVYVIFFWVITIIRITVLSVLYFKIMITVKQHDKVIQRKINKYKAEGGSLISKSVATPENLDRRKDSNQLGEISKESTINGLENLKTQFSSDSVSDQNDSLNSHSTSDSNENPRHKPYVERESHDDNAVLGDSKEIPRLNLEVERDVDNDIVGDHTREVMTERPRLSTACHGKPDSKRCRTVTIVMLTVTVTCMVIYIPYLILASLRAVVKDYECMLSHEERVVYKVFIRSYFMKAIINPLVYGIFDPRFQGAVKNILKRYKRRTQNLCSTL